MYVRSAALSVHVPSTPRTPAAPTAAAPPSPADVVTTSGVPASAPLPALQAPPPADMSVAVAASPLGGPLGQVLASESDRLAAFFKAGGGSTDGLRAPEVAHELLAATQAGARFLSGGRDPEPISAVETYQLMLSPNPHVAHAYLGLEGVQMVAFDRQTLGTGIDAFVPFAEAHREVLRRGRLDPYAMQCALDRIAGQRTPEAITAHAGLLVSMYDRVKASGRHGASSEDAAHAMTGLYDWLAPQLGDLSAARMTDVLAWTERGGVDEARKAGSHARTLDGSAYAEFDGLMRSLGNADECRQAGSVVEQPIAGSTRAQRLETMQRICGLHGGSSSGAEAIGDYRAVADAWKGDESLSSVTDRFVTLHRTLDGKGRADQVRTVFNGLERHWRVSGDESPDRAYMTFVDQVRRTGSVDLAVLETGLSAPTATIERHADGIIVGGIRLPIRTA